MTKLSFHHFRASSYLSFITTPQYMYISSIGYCSVEYTCLVHIKNVRSFVSICCKVTFEHLNFLRSASTRSTSPASPCNRTELRMLYRQRHRQNHPSDTLKLEIPSLFASYSARVLMIPLDKGKHRRSFLNDRSMHTHKYTASSTSLYLGFITQSLLPVGVASLTALEIASFYFKILYT